MTAMSMAESPPIVAQSEMIVQCAWCNAIQLDSAYGVYMRCPAIPLLNSSADNVTHGICGPCYDAELAKVRRRTLD